MTVRTTRRAAAAVALAAVALGGCYADDVTEVPSGEASPTELPSPPAEEVDRPDGDAPGADDGVPADDPAGTEDGEE